MLLPRIRVFLTDRIVLAQIILILIAQLIIWISGIIIFRKTSGSIILHTNIQFGADLIGSVVQFFLIPLTGLIFALANIGLAFYLFVKEKFLSNTLITTAVIIQVLILLAGFNIIAINI